MLLLALPCQLLHGQANGGAVRGAMPVVANTLDDTKFKERAAAILATMSLEEKVGQLVMRMPPDNGWSPDFQDMVRSGGIGAVLNVVEPAAVKNLQRLAIEESPQGIPIVFARDVIHGFRTILPIPLGQAATWNPEMVQQGAAMAAQEAASQGIRWTFAPMIDVARDPRWGRIAESFGEDPFLASVMGVSSIAGYQGQADSVLVAACAKHFAAYGASEGGRDYNSANVSLDALQNIYFPPFQAAVDAGVESFMPSFSDLNGVPPSGNTWLFRDILRKAWSFEGVTVSDWASIDQMMRHGVAADSKDAARQAMLAGMDMDMMSEAYAGNLVELVQDGSVPTILLDEAVLRILMLKLRLGLMDHPYTKPDAFGPLLAPANRALAREMATQATVLLQNRQNALPLSAEKLENIAVIGPLADDPYEQLGTWVFDGKPENSITPLQALRERLGADRVTYVKALERSRDRSRSAFGEAVAAAAMADAAVLFLGEEAILSGEAHSRAYLGLPGAQAELVQAVAATGTPVIVVIMAGRPLSLTKILPHADAILFAWAPGTEGGPALTDLLLGDAVPSGKLPVTFPVSAGQIPMYYAHRNSGNPADSTSFIPIDRIRDRAFQTSLGNTSHYLDEGYKPAFPFGFGLSYTTFRLADFHLSTDTLASGESLVVEATVHNTGDRDAAQTVQLYLRDPVSRVGRPIRELVAFQRVEVPSGEARNVRFELSPTAFAYHYPDGLQADPGTYHLFLGADSRASLRQTVVLAAP